MTEEQAIKYIEASLPYKRTWKMWRFTLYLWARIDNEKKGTKKNRIETVELLFNFLEERFFYL